MSMVQAQIWKGSTFAVDRSESAVPGTAVFRFSGPFTARDMYSALSPDALRNLFSIAADGSALHTLTIFDLSGVPYMDSLGMGMIATEHVRCQAKGVRLILAGVGPRVLQVFHLTRLDTVIPMAATVEEAQANAD